PGEHEPAAFEQQHVGLGVALIPRTGRSHKILEHRRRRGARADGCCHSKQDAECWKNSLPHRQPPAGWGGLGIIAHSLVSITKETARSEMRRGVGGVTGSAGRRTEQKASR